MKDLSTPSSKSIKLFVLGLLSFPRLFRKGMGVKSSQKKSFLLVARSNTFIGGIPLYKPFIQPHSHQGILATQCKALLK
jgi:hypothetical protein